MERYWFGVGLDDHGYPSTQRHQTNNQQKMMIKKNILQLAKVSTMVIASFSGVSAQGFEALISNERSGDIIHVDSAGQTTHVVEICNRPRGMAKGLTQSEVVIACSDDNKVVIYDRFKRQVIKTIDSVPGAMNISIHQQSGRLLVSNEGLSQASVYDLSTTNLIAQLSTGLEPDGVVITDDGKYIFVASENAGLVHVFDGTNYQPTGVIRTNLRPRRIALLDQELWVSSEMGSRVEIFDVSTQTKIDEIIFAPRGFRPEQMTPVDILFNQPANEAYVALGSANHVAVVDIKTREITKYILVGRRAWGLGLAPDGQTLAVLNGLSDDFTFIDLNSKRPRLTKRAGLVPHAIEVFE